MTTTTRPVPGRTRERTPRVLLVAATCVLAAVTAVVLAGALVGGSAAASGALVGGLTTHGFLVLGSVLLMTGTRLAPGAVMLVAMMTFVLQVALVALVFAALSSWDAIGSTLSAGWLSAGVIAAAASWMLGQLYATAKARIPVYDIELPESTETAAPPREAGAW